MGLHVISKKTQLFCNLTIKLSLADANNDDRHRKFSCLLTRKRDNSQSTFE